NHQFGLDMSQTPRIPPLLSEAIIGGFWLASAVKVAGYTWESVSSTWSNLPTPGGGGTTVAPPKAVTKADKALGVPNLARNKNFPLQVAGVAASPINPDTTGTRGIVNTIAGGLVSGGKAVINFLTP